MNVSLLNRFQGCLYGSILSLNINDSEDAIAVDLFLEIIKLLSDSETISLEQWQNLAQKSPE